MAKKSEEKENKITSDHIIPLDDGHTFAVKFNYHLVTERTLRMAIGGKWLDEAHGFYGRQLRIKFAPETEELAGQRRADAVSTIIDGNPGHPRHEAGKWIMDYLIRKVGRENLKDWVVFQIETDDSFRWN